MLRIALLFNMDRIVKAARNIPTQFDEWKKA